MYKSKRNRSEEVPKESAPMAGMGGHPIIRNIVVEATKDCDLETEASGNQGMKMGTCVFKDRQTESKCPV